MTQILARLFYCLILYLLVPLVWLRLLLRARKQPAYADYRWERWGFYPAFPTTKPLLWVHAVSVGETYATRPLILKLLETYPGHDILLTGMTPTGRAAGMACFGAGTELAGRVHQAYLPYDYPGAVNRFFHHFKPRLGVLMETEIWPNLLAASQQHRVPVVLANARLSERSAKGYQRFSALTRPAFQRLSCVAAQTEADAQRLRLLGAPGVTVCGNLKFDVSPDVQKLDLGQQWRAALGDRPVWLAASTREGEETELLAAQRAILSVQPRALCILVPRHPQRFAEVAAVIEQMGFRLTKRSEGLPTAETQVWLGDSMGEMPAYYAATDVSVIGGSWQPLGGQNLIEAAACGAAVIVGPHTFNFTQATDDAIAAGAAVRLPAPSAIPAVLLSFWTDGPRQKTMRAAACQFAQQHQGASERTLACIVGIIPPLH